MTKTCIFRASPFRVRLLQWLKELFYRREIEIFWDAGKKDTYGIREAYRSRFSIINNGMKWRVYSQRGFGNTIHLTTKQMQELLKEAEGFVRNRG